MNDSSTPNSKIILASASPRRLELLQQIGLNPVVHPAHIDETPFQSENARDYVTRMAREKAGAISSSFDENTVIIAADTSVIIDDHILGKPADFSAFQRMFRQLSGTDHQVYSAVCVTHGKRHEELLNISHVRFRNISDAEMLDYWNSGEPVDKAGGYGIQGLGALFVERIEGSYSGIMGLPLYETGILLKNAGLLPFSRA